MLMQALAECEEDNRLDVLKPVYSNRFSATPSPVGAPEFRSFRIGRGSGLDITKGS